MSERIKTPKFNITARDPVHLRQQIYDHQQKTIVRLWRELGIDEPSIQRNREQQEREIRLCYSQLQYPDRPLLQQKSKKDRLNSAVERLDAIFAGMNEARRIIDEVKRNNNKKHTKTSENGNLPYEQEQSFDPNGGVIFAPNSDNH